MSNKPRITTNTTLKQAGTAVQFPYECRGPIICPISRKLITGYGYGYTVEQAFLNWRESPIAF